MNDIAKKIFVGLVVTIFGGVAVVLILSALGKDPTPTPIVIPYNSAPGVPIVTATPVPTISAPIIEATPAGSQPIPETPSQDSGGSAFYESERTWVNYYQGYQVDLTSFPAANDNQVYVLHGDILAENRCKLAVIYAGQSPSQFPASASSWQLVRLTGSEAQIANSLVQIEHNAAQSSNTGTCPRIN